MKKLNPICNIPNCLSREDFASADKLFTFMVDRAKLGPTLILFCVTCQYMSNSKEMSVAVPTTDVVTSDIILLHDMASVRLYLEASYVFIVAFIVKTWFFLD